MAERDELMTIPVHVRYDDQDISYEGAAAAVRAFLTMALEDQSTYHVEGPGSVVVETNGKRCGVVVIDVIEEYPDRLTEHKGRDGIRS